MNVWLLEIEIMQLIILYQTKLDVSPSVFLLTVSCTQVQNHDDDYSNGDYNGNGITWEYNAVLYTAS